MNKMSKNKDIHKINLTLKVWRQENGQTKGHFEKYKAENIDTGMSFLEMLDKVNQNLEEQGIEPIAFDHDCREGSCGVCGTLVNGQAHGPLKNTTLCQLHMREFKDKDMIIIEPFRAQAFPIIKDLVVDRSALDRIIAKGGYISTKTGCAPDANSIPIPKDKANMALEAAACIGCGACIAACPNTSAMLFVGSKITHLSLLPQGKIEKKQRVVNMVTQMDAEGFGACMDIHECEAACPKNIKVSTIAQLNREYMKSYLARETHE